MLKRICELASDIKGRCFNAFGRSDPHWNFRRFLCNIHPDTWEKQADFYNWLDAQTVTALVEQNEIFSGSKDPNVRLARELRDKILAKFRGFRESYADRFRLAVFIPDYAATAAGYSWFMNICDGLEHLGLPVIRWHQGTQIQTILENFKPTVIFANDAEIYHPNGYLNYLDWDFIRDYRKCNTLQIGLVASPYRKASRELSIRLAHSRKLGIDFYYSFQAPEFIARHHIGYKIAGFPVLTLEFGANPLVYYPVPDIRRDLDYVFLGSAHFEKWEQYTRYFSQVMRSHSGLVVGPFWPKAFRTRLDDVLNRYAYARARVGLNLHVAFQLEDATELNERAYNLAACGVPQLIDAPKLLPERFRPESLFLGRTPTEYADQFRYILKEPESARDRARNALEDVLTRHTVFHRADYLLEQITDMEKYKWA